MVRSSDGSCKEGIAGEQCLVFFVIEADASRGVSRCSYDFEIRISEMDNLLISFRPKRLLKLC